MTNRYRDVNKHEVKFRGKVLVNMEYKNNKQKNRTQLHSCQHWKQVKRDREKQTLKNQILRFCFSLEVERTGH